MIIATACLQPLRQQRPGERIVFAAREVMRPLLEDHPLLDGFIPLPSLPVERRSFTTGVGSLAAAFRQEGADLLVHLHPDRLCQRAGARAEIPRRLGYRSSFFTDWTTLTETREDRRHRGLQHEAQYNFDLLAMLGIRSPLLVELRPRVHLAERWRESLRSKFAADNSDASSKYVVLNPTAYSLTHRWPAENFAWLGQQLRSHCDGFVLIGEPADDPGVQALRTSMGGGAHGVVDLAGRLNLGELGWLLRDAALLVSRNTGTTHLAAAVACPVVELFGRLEPAYGHVRWRSLGDNVRAVNTPLTTRRRFESKQAFWRRGFANIRREDVLAAALASLVRGS